MIDFNIPFYGEERHLWELLPRVSNLSIPNLINVSCDQKLNNINRLDKYHNRVRFTFNEPRLGMVGNWNRCLSVGDNDYLTVFHYDDLILKGYGEVLREVCDRFPNAGLIVLGSTKLDLNYRNRIKNMIRGFIFDGFPDRKIKHFQGGDEAIRYLRSIRKVCSGMVLKREVVHNLGYFDEELKYSSDEEYWPRIVRDYEMVVVEKVVVSYRYHKRNYQYDTWEKEGFWDKMVETRKRRFNHLRNPTKDDLEFENNSLRSLANSISMYFAKQAREDMATRYRNFSNTTEII